MMMNETNLVATTPAWDSPRVRQIGRRSLQFVFDVSQISRGQGDVLDPLLLTAILDANQAAIHRDPELALRYGDAGTALPDELRRPISVNALAKSLRLPFETVRRRVAGWVETGICVRTRGGVYVPQAVVTSPAYVTTQGERVARLRTFHRELVHAGFISPLLADALSETAVRAADRALAQYMLRTCDLLIEVVLNPVTGFVLLGLGATGLVGSEESREPAPVATVCANLGMPAETVRRHLQVLARLGFAEHAAKGWRLAAERRTWPKLGRLVAQNETNLRRLFERLDDLKADQPACA